MITLDQVYLLEQKVESAVVKIQQLQAENDALKQQVTELTNALSSKSEQLNTFESDQNQIEDGIKKALERLNSIENSVLKAAQVASTSNIQQTTNNQDNIQQVTPVVPNPQIPSFNNLQNVSDATTEEKIEEDKAEPSEQKLIFNSIEEPEYTESQDVSESEKELGAALNPFNFEADNIQDESEEDNPDELGFDIF